MVQAGVRVARVLDGVIGGRRLGAGENRLAVIMCRHGAGDLHRTGTGSTIAVGTGITMTADGGEAVTGEGVTGTL